MTLKKFTFNVLKKDNQARKGLIETHRGDINTPAFMPVGTQATVKATFIDDIIKTGSEIILGNTYHLMLRPGVERIESIGGLHQFMNCKLPILTDSGGFQVMSLSKLNKIDKEKGAIFKSHIDGKEFILSPEESIRVQKALNSDIVMVMDECPKKSTEYDNIKESMNLSMHWAERSKKAFGINSQKAIFGIVQGGLFKDLRTDSLKQLLKINFDGYAIGGLAVGESQKEMFNVLDDITYLMPSEKPRYLMGVGTPADIIGAVKFYARSIHGLNNEDVRLTSRLFLPSKKLRGFTTRKVGPKDGEDFIGGNYTTALGFEAQLPHLLPESTRTDFTVFLDTANVWSVDYSDTVDETDKIRASVGVGANVWTTIGPLSFTLAQDISKSVNDDTQLFNFRLGTSF